MGLRHLTEEETRIEISLLKSIFCGLNICGLYLGAFKHYPANLQIHCLSLVVAVYNHVMAVVVGTALATFTTTALSMSYL